MASNFVSTVPRNNDVAIFYCCTICARERYVEVDADYYCNTCLKYFCKICNRRQHGWWSLFRHSPYGKDKIMKWPLSEKMETSLLTCVIHKFEKLTMYCMDHSQMCCPQCDKLNHRRCLQVTRLSPAAKRKSTDLKNLSAQTQSTLSRMKLFQTYEEDNMKYLKVLYNEHEKHMVGGMRLKITSILLQCENSTVAETRDHVQHTVHDMRKKITSLLADFKKSNLKNKKERLTRTIARLMSARNSCIRLHDELLQLYVAMQRVQGMPELSFIASKKCQEKIQQSETYLKENFSNRVFIVNENIMYFVKMQGDPFPCDITTLCVLPDGQVLVADQTNTKVKLLDQQYQVVSHCGVTAGPRDMCPIANNMVAVTLDDYRNTHEVQFIEVKERGLVPRSKLKLHHTCRGIAHDQDNLFISSGSALYKYSLRGKLLCLLFEDRSGGLTVSRCAVSPSGDMLYITNLSQDKLLTLDSDGKRLAVFTDPDLRGPAGLHVTPAGKVLVCRSQSHT